MIDRAEKNYQNNLVLVHYGDHTLAVSEVSARERFGAEPTEAQPDFFPTGFCDLSRLAMKQILAPAGSAGKHSATAVPRQIYTHRNAEMFDL